MIELRGINYFVENLMAEMGKDVSQSCYGDTAVAPLLLVVTGLINLHVLV